MLVAVAGTKGSSSVTTLGFALARVWPSGDPAMFVEADPDGGVVAARVGLPQDPGLATLAAGAHHGVDRPAVERHVQRRPGCPPMLLLPSAPGHARAVLRTVAGTLGALGAVPGDSPPGPGFPDMVVDVGRLHGESPALPLAVAAARVVVVGTPTLDGADAIAVRIAELGGLRSKMALVTVGDGPYRGTELGGALSVPHLGHIPQHGSPVRSVWNVGSRRARRSPYLRRAVSIAEQLRVARPQAILDAPVHHVSTATATRAVKGEGASW